MKPVAICLALLRQAVARAFSRAWAKTGKRMAARIAMIAITTSSSIRVKPRFRRMVCLLFWKANPVEEMLSRSPYLFLPVSPGGGVQKNEPRRPGGAGLVANRPGRIRIRNRVGVLPRGRPAGRETPAGK